MVHIQENSNQIWFQLDNILIVRTEDKNFVNVETYMISDDGTSEAINPRLNLPEVNRAFKALSRYRKGY